jgi:hypothetical protein
VLPLGIDGEEAVRIEGGAERPADLAVERVADESGWPVGGRAEILRGAERPAAADPGFVDGWGRRRLPSPGRGARRSRPRVERPE